ncbi:MAG: matrixin family metalloprotease, partial [Longimicrobiales bacterium]|nr:matrixin family metalloprotease [Longimicrobiales bacterium]
SSADVPAVSADTALLATRSQGSAVPCAFPLAWRVARVDPRFELSAGEVEDVIREATGLWESASGRDLFVHDPEGGFPIRLIYDERQAESRERRTGEAELRASADEIEARQEEVAEMRNRYEEVLRRYEASVRDLRERVSAHNDSVRAWNDRGGAPEPVARRLRALEETLRREELELGARADELERRRAEIDAALRDLRSQAREMERRAADLAESFPDVSVEAGIYREAVTWRGDRVESVDREIRIYRFDDRDELGRIAAHELGHAMGLSHVAASDALMSERYARAWGIEARAEVDAADLEHLRDRCPGG